MFSPMQELKGRFIVKGKRLNKLDAFYSKNNTVLEESVSEEDEAAECKENGQKAKAKVWRRFSNLVEFFSWFIFWLSSSSHVRKRTSNWPKSSPTSWCTARASTLTALKTPETRRPSMKCPPLKRVKPCTWLRPQVSSAPQLLTVTPKKSR